jgi:hypothetical protein
MTRSDKYLPSIRGEQISESGLFFGVLTNFQIKKLEYYYSLNTQIFNNDIPNFLLKKFATTPENKPNSDIFEEA